MDKETAQSIREILREELQPIEAALKEHAQIIRALEHSTEIYKAEKDKIDNDIAHIKGDIEALRKDMKTDINNIDTDSNWNYMRS